MKSGLAIPCSIISVVNLVLDVPEPVHVRHNKTISKLK